MDWFYRFMLSWIPHIHNTFPIWGGILLMFPIRMIKIMKKSAIAWFLSFHLGLVCTIVIALFLNVVFSGCPLSYLEEWLEVQVGIREEVTYTFYDSVVYNYIVKPLSNL